MRRLLLISMPLTDHRMSNLALAQLSAIMRAGGAECDVLHATLLLPKSVPDHIRHSTPGVAIFAPGYFGTEEEALAESLADLMQQEPDLQGQATLEMREQFVMDFLLGMEAAETCLRRCLEAIPTGHYDVVAFSVGFDAQKLPSASLARRLKQREPGLKVLFGGTACDGPMGAALLEVFPQVDAVVQGDAETSLPLAVSVLRGETPLEQAQNGLFRREGAIVASPSAAFIPTLDVLPEPCHEDYLAQKERSAYRDEPLLLLFESSRGCWWGEKHHCTFCGLRADGLAYRRRSAQSTLQHIRALYTRYHPKLLYSVDGILDHQYFETLLPDLARLRRESMPDLQLFYEIKSNTGRSRVALLAAAGIADVQPGIESFSSGALKGMRKGATGIQQLELLKWLQTYDVRAVYGLLVGSHEEGPEELRDLLRILPFLHHLPPPTQATRLVLNLFSPYSNEPEAFGIRDIRPFDYQRLIYGWSDEMLLRFCYERNFSADWKTEERDALIVQVQQAIRDWRANYLAGTRMFLANNHGTLVVTWRGPGGKTRLWHLRGDDAAVLLGAQSARSPQALAEHVGLSVEATTASLQKLEEWGLLLRLDGKCLSLPIPLDADAWRDAGLDRPVAAHAVPDPSPRSVARG